MTLGSGAQNAGRESFRSQRGSRRPDLPVLSWYGEMREMLWHRQGDRPEALAEEGSTNRVHGVRGHGDMPAVPRRRTPNRLSRGMRFGLRVPSFRKRIAARTSWKRADGRTVRLGAQRGWGRIKKLRRAATGDA